MEFVFAILIILVVAGVYQWLRTSRARVVVRDYEQALFYKEGKLERVVGVGVYRYNPKTAELITVDTRRTSLVVQGQEVATRDNIGLKVSALVTFSVVNATKAITSVQSYYNELYSAVQLALREALAGRDADDLHEKLTELATALESKVMPQAEAIGLELHSIQIRDFMFPGDIKRAFNEVLKARKEGEAALEKARGESAALRNLANAAKLLDNNPNLLSLRLMQAIEASKGNSFSLDSSLFEVSQDS